MNKKAKMVLNNNFNSLERNLLIRYFRLCNLDEALCDNWDINGLDKTFYYIRNVKLPMYENNSSMTKLISKYYKIIMEGDKNE